MRSMVMVLILGLGLVTTPALAQESTGGSSSTNMEILKEKLKADKKLLIASNMQLSDAEAKQFWPLYEAYQKELQHINDRLVKTIKSYADAYNQGQGMIKEDEAKRLLQEALSVDEAEVKLRRAYSEKIGKVLPATKTARYIQMENKIRALLRFELAREIPLVD